MKYISDIRTLCWWAFVYHQWPMRFVRSALYDLFDAAKEGAIAFWHLLRIPLQPIVMIVAYVGCSDIREKLRAAHARKAKYQGPIRIRGSISFI